jgi:DNA-binding transcriptional LysR family regulator
MPEVGLPTLEQLRVLKTVADTGSFSEAARRLNKAQSVVSYAIGNLEEQLGLSLFDRRARGPVLTDAGRAILGDARRVSTMIDELRARAGGLQSGIEASLGLAVDVMFPTQRLVEVLEAFAHAYPTVDLNLQIEALGGVAERVMNGTSTLGLSGWAAMELEQDAFVRRQIGTVELIPVAAPWHPLARYPIGEAASEHVQLVLTDRSTLTEGRDFGVLAARQWRLSDLGAKHALLKAGLGWGHMPELMVRNDLEAGALVRLNLPETHGVAYDIFLIHRADRPLGPAGNWLAGRLGEACNGDCGQSRPPTRFNAGDLETVGPV